MEVLALLLYYSSFGKTTTWRFAEVFLEDTGENTASKEQLTFPIGQPNDAYAQFFVGQGYLAPLAGGYANVTFEPGCRNNWHIHLKAVQVLICVAGRGWYQEWGQARRSAYPWHNHRNPRRREALARCCGRLLDAASGDSHTGTGRSLQRMAGAGFGRAV